MVPILELGVAQLEAKLAANAVAPFVLIQAVLPGMLAMGQGTIVDVTSHTATSDPPGPVGRGGWGVAYAASKAAAHRFAPLLAVELGDRGIRAYNLDPGYVETERQLVNAAALGLVGHYQGAPPSVPAAAIAWMVDHPEALENGQTVRGLKLALDEGLHPDWRGAVTAPAPTEVTVYWRPRVPVLRVAATADCGGPDCPPWRSTSGPIPRRGLRAGACGRQRDGPDRGHRRDRAGQSRRPAAWWSWPRRPVSPARRPGRAGSRRRRPRLTRP